MPQCVGMEFMGKLLEKLYFPVYDAHDTRSKCMEEGLTAVGHDVQQLRVAPRGQSHERGVQQGGGGAAARRHVLARLQL